MTLEDFEKSLAKSKTSQGDSGSRHRHEESKSHHKHRRHHHRDGEDHHKHKRRRHSHEERDREGHSRKRRRENPDQSEDERFDRAVKEESVEKDTANLSPAKHEADATSSSGQIRRDTWMEEPSHLDIDFTQRGIKRPSDAIAARSSKVDFELKIHDNELNKHHLKDLAEGKEFPEETSERASNHNVDYLFGDAGAQWRMTKLKGVYRRAEETGRSLDDVAEEQYGDLQAFDDAREEQIELDRRDTYGEGYVGKEKPSGELSQERKLDLRSRKGDNTLRNAIVDLKSHQRENEAGAPTADTLPLDQTALNRLKAQMLKAKVRGSSNASKLEAEYINAIAGFANSKQPEVVVLGAMDNRMLAGSRSGEVTSIDNKRGRERGLVEENDDMSIDDMVKQERRTRHQTGGDSQRFAERIAKDAKFDNDHDYLDENANRLAKRVQKSEINLKNIAISDFQKLNRILDSCPLCHHEDAGLPPVAPIVSLATRVYLTLPTEPEISDGGACIIPVQHRVNLLECDDDEWEEIRVRIAASSPLAIRH